MYVTWQIRRYERTDDSVWSTSYDTITNFYSPVVRTSLGEGRDTFSFKQTNINDTLDSYWNIGDKLEIYYKVNSSTISSSDLLLNGVVTNVPNQDTFNTNMIRVEGNNYSETLMSALAFYKPLTPVGINEFLQGIIKSVELNNANFNVTWNSGNPTVKTDGSAFPTIDERWYYKSILKGIEKYSSNAFTEDGNYYWYVDVDNTFVWRPKTNDVLYTFDADTDAYRSLKTKNDTKGIVNFIVAKGGRSPKNKPITIRRDDAVSRAKHGFKYKLIISEHNTSRRLMEDDGVVENFPSSYPFTTTWESKVNKASSPEMVVGSTVTIDNDGEYDNAIIAQVKQLLKDEADDYILNHKNGKLMVELEFINGKGWSIGDIINMTVPMVDKADNPMRVKDAEYTINGERYTIIEDEGTI